MGKEIIGELRKAFEYDFQTGKITWKVDRGKRYVKGNEAGNVDAKGYRTIEYDYKHIRAGRLSWCLYYGRWPNGVIDHINGNRDDNRIENLRDVNVRTNGGNTEKHRSGHTIGTYQRGNKWRAQIWINGKSRHLGYFDTKEQAGEAYMDAVSKEAGE